ncbi:DUF3466 family protein [Methylomonas sp. AM2-LC]|uniref:DUF3466 family protein n=1 Tax=Methylomonas sp. AM2-LC TaxID=3153301 RepID=UPI003263222E
MTVSQASQADTYNYTTIDNPNQTGGTVGFGINNSGQISGYYFTGAQRQTINSFVYDGSTYTTINDPNALAGTTVASDINNNGILVGDFQDSTGPHGFLYNGSTYTTLNYPNATGSGGTIPISINDTGEVAGIFYTGNNNVGNGFLYNGSTYTTLNDPNSTKGTYAYGINNSGDVVGYFDNGNVGNGFLYNGSTYTTLIDPNATNGTYALGINNNGEVVGYYTDSTGNHAFVYNGSTYTTLNYPNTTPNNPTLDTYAFGINDSGKVTGYFVNNHGVSLIGFVATPATVPVPTSVWLFGSALAGFIGFNRRKTA